MRNTLIIFLLFASQILSAQEVHSYFKNFSFEDFPRPSIAPRAWTTFLFENETPPDIHPSDPPTFEVVTEPFHGSSYLGLVARANRTWESVTQPLEVPLEKQGCYSMSIYLCQSPNYNSKTTWAGEEILNFNAPTVLRIWGDYGRNKIELLAVTPPVNHLDWKKYTLVLSPTRAIESLILEAYYPLESEPVNGHILLDNLSPILEISCNEKDTPLNDEEASAQIANQLELFHLIESQGRKIAFDQNNQLTSESETTLKQIGEKLYYADDKKLLLYLKSTNRRKYIPRYKAFNQMMIDLGYTIDMFEIKMYKEKDSEKNWIVKSPKIYIGIGKR